MESDIKLHDNGSVEIIGDKVELLGSLILDSGFKGGTIQVSGSNFKTTVTDIEMYFFGGCLSAKGGSIELGSRDSGVFKGFSQSKDGSIKIAGDKLVVTAKSVEVGMLEGTVSVAGNVLVQNKLTMKIGSKFSLLTPSRIIKVGGEKTIIEGREIDLLSTILSLEKTILSLEESIKTLQQKVAALEN